MPALPLEFGGAESFTAPPERVFAALSDPEAIDGLGPAGALALIRRRTVADHAG